MDIDLALDTNQSALPTLEPCNISIIVVWYYPTAEDIDFIVNFSALEYDLIVIDNSDTPYHIEPTKPYFKYIFNGKNLGIAKAHNIGIQEARKNEKSDYIILLDQDSRIDNDYPLKIVKEHIRISQKIQISALGPLIVQKNTDETYVSALHKHEEDEMGFIFQKDIISSGCCIRKDLLEKVGGFDEKLFIDFVDTEWCYRAKSMGYTCGITSKLSISHMVGKGELHIWKHIVSLSAPARYYYIYRNYFFLTTKKHVPTSFKINFGIKLFLRFFYLPFFLEQGFLCWKNMVRGIRDGLRGVVHK